VSAPGSVCIVDGAERGWDAAHLWHDCWVCFLAPQAAGSRAALPTPGCVPLLPSPPSGWNKDLHMVLSPQQHARTYKPPGRARHTTSGCTRTPHPRRL